MTMALVRSRGGYYLDFAIVPTLVAVAAATEQLSRGIGLAWLAAMLAGALAWTLAEYLIHRIFLHRLYRALHAEHHRVPAAYVGPSSFFTVAVVGVLLVLLLALMGQTVGGGAWAGILLGYFSYIVMHDALHRRRIPRGHWLRPAFDRHMLHHRGIERNFGVTTALWDRMFGTAGTIAPAEVEPDGMDFPFTTDGCSGGMTALWRVVYRRDPPWNDLCVEHDRAYWAGGSAIDRRQADRALMAGVTLNGHPVFAFAMWCAVRIGGHPLLPTSWRWGYGWKWPRGYTAKEGP